MRPRGLATGLRLARDRYGHDIPIRVRAGADTGERLSIYARGYIDRLIACLQADYPAMRALVGDALFALGCGRMFEGTPPQFWASLQRLRDLPDDTLAYCAHEYTQSNARFALTVEPQNRRLKERAEQVARLRAAGTPTVPSTLGEERATNPFLRPQSGDLRATIGLTQAPDVEVFAKTRALKDAF